MNLHRRSLLKGMALGGLGTVAMAHSGLSLAGLAHSSVHQPLVVLVTNPQAESAFVMGVQAQRNGHPVKIMRTDLGMKFIADLQAQLSNAPGTRLVGLVDDASAALVLDLARSSGATVQWTAQHSVQGAHSQHAVLAGRAADGCSVTLGHSLSQCGSGFALREEQPFSHQADRQLNAAARHDAHADQWATTLGYSLAGLGQPQLDQAPQVNRASHQLQGQFVSFSIQC